MPKFKIVTDSASDLPEAELSRLGIGVVPLTIRFDDKEYVDKVDLSTADFWKMTQDAAVLPSTAAPSPGAFAAEFKKAQEDKFDGVICVTLSSKLSGTNSAALGGQREVEGFDVRVIDSLTCTVAQAEIILQAAALVANEELSLDEIETQVRTAVSKQRLLGSLDTLDFLRKGGRVGAANAFFAALLAVKPVIKIEDGVVKPLAKQRTRSRALKYLAEVVINEGKVSNVGVCHSGAPDIDEFIDMLAPVAKREDILVTEMGPTIGVHGGPRLIAVTFSKD